MTRTLAADLKVGDVILPPARELRLWMTKRMAEQGLPESAAHVTITEIKQGAPDKLGAWLIVRGTAQFAGPWAIKMRPTTMWPRVN